LDREFVKRYWFLGGLILLIPVGIMVPDIGLALKKTDWVIPVFVGIMLGIAGFTMDTSSLVKQVTNFRAVVPVLVSIYIFSPVAAYSLAKLLAPAGSQDFLPAMMIMAAQAGSLASAIALTMMSGGNRELALICTVMSNGLTFLLTPFILHLSVGPQEDFPVAELMQRMIYVVLVPIILGQLLRHSLWGKTKSVRAFIRVFPQFIILMFVYIGFASGSEKLQEDFNIVLRFLAACVLLHLLLLGLNTLISGLLGLKWPERTAMILCGSQKTLPNGMDVWKKSFGDNEYGAVPLVLYHLFQLLVDTLLVSKLEQKNPTSKGSISESVAINCHGNVKD
jgi:sodium/bile acid cotransporter 7